LFAERLRDRQADPPVPTGDEHSAGHHASFAAAGPVTGQGRQISVVAEKLSPVLGPPPTSTIPSGSAAAPSPCRASRIGLASCQVRVAASYRSTWSNAPGPAVWTRVSPPST